MQELNGCTDELTEDVLVRIGPFEFKECPVRFLEAEDEQLVALVNAGLELPAQQERLHMPARWVEALWLISALKGGADVR